MNLRAVGPLDALHAIREAALPDGAPQWCKAVAMTVASYVGYGGNAGAVCWASVETIGKGAGCGPRTAQRCIGWMLGAGLLSGSRSRGRATNRLLVDVGAWRRLAAAKPPNPVTLTGLKAEMVEGQPRPPDTVTPSRSHRNPVRLTPYPDHKPDHEPTTNPEGGVVGGEQGVGGKGKASDLPDDLRWLEAER